MSYLKDKELWLSKVPTGNPPTGYTWKYISNGNVIIRDSNGVNRYLTSSQDIYKIVKLTQVEYDAIGSPDANTLYVIVG